MTTFHRTAYRRRWSSELIVWFVGSSDDEHWATAGSPVQTESSESTPKNCSRMSRRSGTAAGGSTAAGAAANRAFLVNGAGADGAAPGAPGPPSHPMEQHPDHRAFLMRSLKRNDVDLAAIMELNRSLHSVKDAIIRTCGELTLLNLGEGQLTLLEDGEQGERLVVNAATASGSILVELPDEEGQELCVDFLLRMKLRRKLLNRLARRLNRVAHAMDGNDVAPPGPPRYGDLRLHVDEKEVRVFSEMRERQEQAIRAIQEQREKQSLMRHAKGAPAEGKENAGKAGDPSEDTETGENPTTSALTCVDEAAVDYDVLKSYDDAYEKRVDPATGAYKYTLLERPPEEEDCSRIRFGGGIGATHRSMSTKEKEAEFLRWQTALLGRIPDQPTFAETGMEDRVFLLEERRKRAVEEAKKRKRAEALDESSSDSDYLDAMDVEQDAPAGSSAPTKPSKNEQSTELESSLAKETESDDDDEIESKSSEEKGENKGSIIADASDDDPEKLVVKKVKPISLAAVPSFYEQDFKRIKQIHNELIAASILEQSRRRVEEVTKAYNHGTHILAFRIESPHSSPHCFVFLKRFAVRSS
jgi:hypothetical protein